MNILVIEDNILLAEKIGGVFRSKVITNRVQVIYSYNDFLKEYPIISTYDIVLTDIKLSNDSKNNDGYEIIKLIRKKNTKIPIIVISGNDNIDRLRYAFDCGANDYIIKPIRLKELEIRILNWYKNYYLSNTTFLGKTNYYKDLSYNIDTNEFYYKGKSINLTKNNKYILSLFFANPGKILSPNFLIEKIWGDIYMIVDRNLRVNILRLKKGLEPFGIDGRIQNIRGEGYILSAD